MTGYISIICSSLVHRGYKHSCTVVSRNFPQQLFLCAGTFSIIYPSSPLLVLAWSPLLSIHTFVHSSSSLLYEYPPTRYSITSARIIPPTTLHTKVQGSKEDNESDPYNPTCSTYQVSTFTKAYTKFAAHHQL